MMRRSIIRSLIASCRMVPYRRWIVIVVRISPVMYVWAFTYCHAHRSFNVFRFNRISLGFKPYVMLLLTAVSTVQRILRQQTSSAPHVLLVNNALMFPQCLVGSYGMEKVPPEKYPRRLRTNLLAPAEPGPRRKISKAAQHPFNAVKLSIKGYQNPVVKTLSETHRTCTKSSYL